MRRTRRRRSIRLHPGQNGRCTIVTEIPKSERPHICICLPKHKWPKSWSSMEDPVVLLARNLYGHPLAGLLLGRQFEKVLPEHGWEKVPHWECSFVNRRRGLFLSVYVDDIKLVGKKQNVDPMWKVLWKKSIWENQHHFLTTSAWSALNGNGKHVKKMSTITKYVRIQERKSTWLRETRRRHLFMVLWYARSCKEMCGAILWTGEQNNPATVQSRNSMPWRPSIQRRRIGIRWRIVKSLLSNCPKVPVFGTHWWTRHSMVSKQTCTSSHQNGPELVPDAWLVWFLMFNTHPSQFKQFCQLGERLLHRNFEPQDPPKGPFRPKKGTHSGFWVTQGTPMLAAHPVLQASDFAGDFEDSKSTSGEILCIFGSHTFVPISGMCKKPTSVSHSSTVSEVISLDAGLRIDGFPALDLWDLVI